MQNSCGWTLHTLGTCRGFARLWIGHKACTGVEMTYQLQFLRDDGSPACFFMTQCVSDEQAKAIAKSVLDIQFSGVEILRGEQLIYQELKFSKPN